MNAKKCKNALIAVFLALVLILSAGCKSERQYNFSLKDTLAIFLVKKSGEYYFVIPVQYMGDYHVGNFDYKRGTVTIGDYEIELNRNKINIYAYLSESANEQGGSISGFNQIYSEENGNKILSKMNEPLAVKQSSGDIEVLNHYYIFIEKPISNDEYKNIIKEYEKRNVNSRMSIWYDITIDDEPQYESGMLDDFELYDGEWIDPEFFPPNLNYFKEIYLGS